jgi:radical SAM superfamily enzyme YgiQ (UPF0313 family)
MGLEYFRAFPFIDHVVVGEGETAFPALARQVLSGQQAEYPPGVVFRHDGQIRLNQNRSLFTEFAKTGPPDYDDYYHLLAELGDTKVWTGSSFTKAREGAGGAKSIIARSAG